MQSIFKKTLLAAAVASVGVANAATIGTTDRDAGTAGVQVERISAQGLEIAGSVGVGSAANQIDVTFTSGADYQETDLLVLTIVGATITNTSAASISLVDTTDNTNGSDGDGDQVENDGTVEAIGVDPVAGTITFRPESGTEFEAMQTWRLTGLQLTDASGTISVSSAGRTVQNIAFDNGAAQGVAAVVNQFAVTPNSAVVLDRTIDVENMRKQFVDNGTDLVTDAISYNVANAAEILAVTTTTSTIALSGSNLDFLLDGDGDLDGSSYALTGATEDTTAANAASLADNTLRVNGVANAGLSALGLTLTADGVADADAQALEAQSFTADVYVRYSLTLGADPTTPGTVHFNDLGAGSWDLSGASRNIPYMPFGSGISQILWISNDGDVAGDIEMTAFDAAGNQFGPVVLDVQAGANRTTNIGAAVRQALEDEGASLSSGSARFDLTFVINSPDEDIEMNAAYNVRGDRVAVPVNGNNLDVTVKD